MKVAQELPNTTNWSLLKVAKELPNVDTFAHLGNKALYLVATLPEKKNKQKNTPIKDVQS